MRRRKKDTKSKEKDNKESHEEANNSKKRTSLEYTVKEDLEIEGKRAPDPVDTFYPKELDMISGQEVYKIIGRVRCGGHRPEKQLYKGVEGVR